jgi:adenylate cyclase
MGYLAHEYELDRYASDRAIALNPNSAANFWRRGLLEMWLGNYDAAEDAIRRAMRLSPLDPDMGWMLFALSNTFAKAGRFKEGLDSGLAAIREMPTNVQSFAPVIVCFVGLGRLEEAREYGARLLQMSPNFTIEKYFRTSAMLPNLGRKRYAEAFRLAGLPE